MCTSMSFLLSLICRAAYSLSIHQQLQLRLWARHMPHVVKTLLFILSMPWLVGCSYASQTNQHAGLTSDCCFCLK